jgi:hypothetical protein
MPILIMLLSFDNAPTGANAVEISDRGQAARGIKALIIDEETQDLTNDHVFSALFDCRVAALAPQSPGAPKGSFHPEMRLATRH